VVEERLLHVRLVQSNPVPQAAKCNPANCLDARTTVRKELKVESKLRNGRTVVIVVNNNDNDDRSVVGSQKYQAGSHAG
jgi:hypothetical protein